MIAWAGEARGRRPRAVALVGIDGSGKTTQAHRLAEALKAAGIRASYRRNAGGRYWLGRVARRLGRRDAVSLLGASLTLVVESVLRWLAIAWALISSTCSGRLAVMDRYAVCQFASIRAHAGGRGERLARLAYWIFPPPEMTVLLSVSPDEAYRRIEIRGTDHETIEYLIAADQAYGSLPEYRSFVVVDANLPADEVSREIQARLAPLLAQSCPPSSPGQWVGASERIDE